MAAGMEARSLTGCSPKRILPDPRGPTSREKELASASNETLAGGPRRSARPDACGPFDRRRPSGPAVGGGPGLGGLWRWAGGDPLLAPETDRPRERARPDAWPGRSTPATRSRDRRCSATRWSSTACSTRRRRRSTWSPSTPRRAHSRWRFDPPEGKVVLGKRRNRGVTYWAQGQRQADLLRRAAGSCIRSMPRPASPIPPSAARVRIDLREDLAPGRAGVGRPLHARHHL